MIEEKVLRMDRQTDGQTDGRTDGQTDGQTRGWAGQQTDGRAGGRTGEEVIGLSDSMAGLMMARVGINRDNSGGDGDSWVTIGKWIEILPKKAAK